MPINVRLAPFSRDTRSLLEKRGAINNISRGINESIAKQEFRFRIPPSIDSIGTSVLGDEKAGVISYKYRYYRSIVPRLPLNSIRNNVSALINGSVFYSSPLAANQLTDKLNSAADSWQFASIGIFIARLDRSSDNGERSKLWNRRISEYVDVRTWRCIARFITVIGSRPDRPDVDSIGEINFPRA